MEKYSYSNVDIYNYRTSYITWNPWHGCHKCSVGCNRCYIFEEDKARNIQSNNIKINKTLYKMPTKRNKDKSYKVESGSVILVCNTSDFFIEEADVLRKDAWKIIEERKDCLFHIITKRIDRFEKCIPSNWFNGWQNVMISVSVSNEEEAWTNVIKLLSLPIAHRGIVIEPMLEYIDISPFLMTGMIKEVKVGGETYNGMNGYATKCSLADVAKISDICKYYETNFRFSHTGSRLITYDNKLLNIGKRDEKGLADFYKLNYISNVVGKLEDIAKNLDILNRISEANKVYSRLKEAYKSGKEQFYATVKKSISSIYRRIWTLEN